MLSSNFGVKQTIKLRHISFISKPVVKFIVLYYLSLNNHNSNLLHFVVNFAPFWNHVLPFWKRRKDPNILFLKYEELKADLPAAIRKTAKFLEKELTEAQIEKLAAHLSFESMKNNPAVNYDWLVKMSNWLTRDNNSFMRKGKVGGYKEVMTPEMIERFDTWTYDNIKDTDLTYP